MPSTAPDSVPDTAPEAAPSAASPTVSPTVLTRSVRYHADGGALLERLTRSGLLRTTAGPATQGGSVRPVDCVLLESADITTKASRTTVAVLEASARLTCWGGTVTAEALDAVDGGGPGADGLAALARLEAGLAEHVTDRRPGRLTLTLPTICDDDPTIEERERLTALSTIEPLRLLARAEVDHPHLPLEAGAFAFDYLSTFESLPEVAQGANTCPDYLFYDARIILVVDHPTQEATLVGASVDAADLERRMEALATAIDGIEDPADSAETATDTAVEAPPPAGGVVSSGSPVLHAVPTVSDADFEAVVEEMRGYIADGDVYQVVPSRGFTIDCPDALAAYHVLRHANPSPYMFYLAAPDFELFGASPESALLYSVRSGRVAIRPIAGTRPRGLHPDGSVDHERDTRLELELRTDAKEVAEHVMLVDLARNDVARVSRPGTRSVQDLLRVDRYSRVMHLVSEVSGELAEDLDALDAFRASMTMGTLTGAPKLRAAELIRQAEGVRRGSYGGSVGYIRGDGELDTCIVIRSGFVSAGTALVQAGAGVVAASSPAAEAAETVHKARAVLEAVAAAQGATLVIDQTGNQAGNQTGSRTSKEA
ncbi:anthranilate synthase component 1 [Actinomyces oris]|uniref:anthranilate synthase n=1 Tax=Actinomyces oris TaxID=544580 RepID=A0AAE4G0Z9_9ACTO|nr:anthranilate synthase component 1 [Actinomyces oris]MDT0248579.1 anthranilate synthase component 1 [Actinomyces oris]